MIKSFLFVSLFCSTMLAAQEKAAHPIQSNNLSYAFGLKGGVSFSNMDLRSEHPFFLEGNNARSGIYLGVVYHKPLSRRWALQPELVYASQGYKAIWGDTAWTSTEQVRQGYVNIPLLMQYVSTSGFSLYTGSQVGLLVYNAHYAFKDWDLAWVGGAAYLSKTGLGAEVRYNAGLLNIGRGVAMPEFREARNRVLQAGVVYLFAQARKRGT